MHFVFFCDHWITKVSDSQITSICYWITGSPALTMAFVIKRADTYLNERMQMNEIHRDLGVLLYELK